VTPPLLRLESFCDVRAGATPSRAQGSRFFGGDIPWVKSGELRDNLILDTEEHITQSALDETNLKLAPSGAILLAMYGATAGRLGVLGIPATTNQAVCQIIPDPAQADWKYVFYALRSQLAKILARRVGGAQPNISQSIVRELEISLPEISEQRRIAGILSQAEALRAMRGVALTQLDVLAQSIFLAMFGDPGSNAKMWPIKRLEEVFEIERGGSPRPIEAFVTDDADGINWITIGDATDKFIRATKRRIKPEGARRSRFVKEGDFLLTNSMSFGRPYILKTSGCIHDGWLVLSPRAADTESEYFYWLLSSDAVYAEFVRRAPGATVKNLNIDLVRDVSVPVAPIPLQREFAVKIARLDELRDKHMKSMAELVALFASLQHRAFRGEL
jgi:type I restriction enzyme S subunit